MMIILIEVIAVLVAMWFVKFFINIFVRDKWDREYVITEMRRATTEKEYKRWKKELRRLRLEAIPLSFLFIKD